MAALWSGEVRVPPGVSRHGHSDGGEGTLLGERSGWGIGEGAEWQSTALDGISVTRQVTSFTQWSPEWIPSTMAALHEVGCGAAATLRAGGQLQRDAVDLPVSFLASAGSGV